MAAAGAHSGLEQLSRRFLNGDTTSTADFQVAVRPLVMRIARRYAWELAEDQRDDVIQETMLLLLQLGGSGFNSTRGSAVTFVGMLSRRAARDVSAQYAPPGRRTRPPSRRDAEALEQFRRASHVPNIDELTDDAIPAVNDIDATETKIDVTLVLRRAPAGLGGALRRIYFDDMPVGDVAKAMGISRFCLLRQIRAFSSQFRAA